MLYVNTQQNDTQSISSHSFADCHYAGLTVVMLSFIIPIVMLSVNNQHYDTEHNKPDCDI